MDAGYILTLHLFNPKAILRKNKKLKMWRATLEDANRTIKVWKDCKFGRVVAGSNPVTPTGYPSGNCELNVTIPFFYALSNRPFPK